VLVIAVGNPDRGDDGIGALVATRLTGRLPAGVALVHRRGDMLGLLDDWSRCEAVICVDAAAPMEEPGRIHRFDGSSGALPHDLSPPSSHSFGLAEALALARALGSAPPVVIIYAVEGQAFETGAPMTPEVVAAAGEVADRIVAEAGRLAVEVLSHA
jgi:hydrogenase maturation protease